MKRRSCWPSVLEKTKRARSAKSIGRISKERHPDILLNQNGFTWKRMKPTVRITAQSKSVTMIGLKAKKSAESKLIQAQLVHLF